jgi:hypothetical protein
MKRKDILIDPAQIQIAIEAAIQDLVEEGLVFDTGRKQWSNRTGRYEIVWAHTGLGETRHSDVMVTPRWVDQVMRVGLLLQLPSRLVAQPQHVLSRSPVSFGRNTHPCKGAC